MPKKPAVKNVKNVVDPLAPLLDQLGDKVIAKISDAGVKAAVSAIVALGRGVQKAHASNAPQDIADKAELDEAGVTPTYVVPLLQGAVDLVAAVEDRDAKLDAYHDAVNVVQSGTKVLEVSQAKVASKLRGSFGNTSAELSKFGVPALGGGHNGGRKSSPKSSNENGPSGSAQGS